MKPLIFDVGKGEYSVFVLRFADGSWDWRAALDCPSAADPETEIYRVAHDVPTDLQKLLKKAQRWRSRNKSYVLSCKAQRQRGGI